MSLKDKWTFQRLIGALFSPKVDEIKRFKGHVFGKFKAVLVNCFSYGHSFFPEIMEWVSKREI